MRRFRLLRVYFEHVSPQVAKYALDEERGSEVLASIADAPTRPERGLAVADPKLRPRSNRAVEDKVASVRASYALISDHNNGTLVGSTGHPEWFYHTDHGES